MYQCKYKARVQNCPGITISTFQISPGQCYGQGQGQGQGGWGGWGGRVGIGYVGWGGWGGQVVVVIGLVGVVGVQWLWWSWCRSVKKWLESHCVRVNMELPGQLKHFLLSTQCCIKSKGIKNVNGGDLKYLCTAWCWDIWIKYLNIDILIKYKIFKYQISNIEYQIQNTKYQIPMHSLMLRTTEESIPAPTALKKQTLVSLNN